MTQKAFGKTPDGIETKLFVCSNAKGATMQVTDYGARLVSVDVPAGSVNTTPCDTPGNDGVAQPYFVRVVNQGTDGPFPAATCLQANGSTTFDNNTPVDLFSSPTNAGFALTGAPLAVGTQFQFNITPNTGGPQTVVTTLDNPEAANPDRFAG